MSNKIRPLNGWRRVKVGEIIPSRYKVFDEDGSCWADGYKDCCAGYVAVTNGFIAPIKLTKPRRKQPTAEECWRWAFLRRASIDPVFTRNNKSQCCWKMNSIPTYAFGKTHLAAVRAAIKSERGKK